MTENTVKNGVETGMEIAVIGMAGRFPGAGNLEQYWDNIKNGRETLTFFTDQELEESGIDAASIADPNYTRARGIIEGVEYFDATFFGYTAAEARIMDPQMRLFHECTWEALEDAGYNPEAYRGRIGLYGGASDNFYWRAQVMLSGVGQYIDAFSTSQLTNKDYLTTRVSFALNLRGPSYFVQTACSTSLVAVHLAGQGLLSGECGMAVAGGVTVTFPQKRGHRYSEGMVVSPDGHCRAFDAGANGFVSGNGVGVVVLKLLEDAITDGDHIHAVIKGSAVNNDGKQKAGFTAPSIRGQASVIRAAFNQAEVEPETVDYVETHGTGTPLGDPIEIESLKRAYNTDRRNYCKIGSVKTNFGHLDAAAGAAGLIKTIQALKHKQIPPSLHFKTPNPKIDFQNSPFSVNTELSPWTNETHPRRAGVSSFGIGGTNAHIILQEAPDLAEERAAAAAKTRESQLILLSAKTEAQLEQMTANLAAHFSARKNPGLHLADAAYTLKVGRKAHKYRRMVQAATLEEAIAGLSKGAELPYAEVRGEKTRVVFMFPGLGGQYVDMGRDLYDNEPEYRREMDRCFEILDNLRYNVTDNNVTDNNVTDNNVTDNTDKDRELKIKEILYPEETVGTPGLHNRTDVAQLLVFIVEYALARQLMAWGIEPHAMIGYSFGEYTAACIAGVIGLEDALRVIVARGKLLREVPDGTMLSVPMTAEELKPYITPDISIAIDNGNACIVAGTTAAVAALEKKMKEKKRMCMPLSNSTAIHSPMMDPILERFRKVMETVPLAEPQIPYITNLTGTWADAGDVVRPETWVRHLRETVRFAGGLAELTKTPDTVLVEVGPGRDVSTMTVRFISEERGQTVMNLTRHPGQKQSDVRYLLRRLGQLWMQGVEIDWSAFYKGQDRYRVPLPTYPFERQRHWMETNLHHLTKTLTAPGAAVDKEIPEKEAVEPGETEQKPETAAADTTELPRLQRSELSAPYAAAENALQKVMVEIWERFFGAGPIGIHDDFFELRGDSLKAMNMAAQVRKELGVEIPVQEFFTRQTIEGLADYIKREIQGSAGENAAEDDAADIGGNTVKTLPPVEEQQYYPVSSAQRRLYVLQQMGENNTGYNETVAVIVEGALDTLKLENTLKQIVQRQESFRTSFTIIDGEPVQEIHPAEDIQFSLEQTDLDEIMARPENAGKTKEDVRDRLVNEFVRVFDLANAPLLRAGVIRETDERHVVMVDMHHIITDGTSQVILIEDLFNLYLGKELPELPVQYRHFSQWQNRMQATGKLKEQEEYWLNEFAEEITEIDLPSDYPRPPFLNFEGRRIVEIIEKEQTGALRNLALKENATLYQVLLSIFNIFLHKMCGSEDIVCGSLIAGRRFAELQRLIGMFVNTLALRNYPAPEKTVRQFLEEVKQKTLEAYRNQDYQFETLVEQVTKNRDTGRNPLFDFIFVLQNMQSPEHIQTGLKINLYPYRHTTSKFDLKLETAEGDDQLTMTFEYRTSLFKEESIRRFIGYFKIIMAEVLRDPGRKIADIDIMSEEERERLLVRFNDTAGAYDRNRTLHGLFRDGVEKHPERLAVESAGDDGVILTYRQLDEAARRQAVRLRANGVVPGSVVGVMVNRTVGAVVGLMAVLKTGAAFLPIDPEYPAARKEFMVEDSRIRLLLTQKEIIDADPRQVEQLANGRIQIIDEPAENTAPGGAEREEHDDAENPAETAYVIYTSGSTGKPKGVMVEHRNVVNYILWAIDRYVQGETVKFPLFTSLSFDLTVTTMFTPLLSGGSQVVYEGRGRESLIEKIIEEDRVDVVKLTPAHLKLILEHWSRKDKAGGQSFQSRIKRFIVGGEALETRLAAEITERFGSGLEIYNEYGPTETAVGCMIYRYDPGTDRRATVPIGVPAANVQIYVLDKNLKPLPAAVPGEMYISGGGVARGYLNRPEMTAQRFVENPFAESETGEPRRMYRTGDQARHLPDGNIEFLGRIDHQVKIRGYRIELEEIQGKLREYRKGKLITPAEDDFRDLDLAAVQRCNRCLLPHHYPNIQLDDDGVCRTCRRYEKYRDNVDTYFKGETELREIIDEARSSSLGDYDCLLLFSGGKDSTYVLYRLKEMGLKVLTFTFDNGYISDAAFANIKRTTEALGVDSLICDSENMNRVFVESLNTYSDVCHGCWQALNTIGAKIAYQKGINLVVSGLSRGQIFEMRLEGLFEEGIYEEQEVEQHLLLFRKSFHSKSNKFGRLLDVKLEEDAVHQIYFLDYFRYVDTPVAEIRAYLEENGWQQPEDTGFCSSNCLINDVGIYTHLKGKGYHFYAEQLSWDIRLGVIPRETGLHELTSFKDDYRTVGRILEEIGYNRPPVSDVQVMERERNGETILAAYIVSDDELSVPELREYMAGQLPDYMIPTEYIQVERIPLTPNGKVDRRALENMGKKIDGGVEYVAPNSDKEIGVAAAWKDVLGVEDVGVNDNFFDQGGTSVDIIRVSAKIREQMGIDIPIVVMYKYTTIKTIAQFLENGEDADAGKKQDRTEHREKGKSDRQKRREMRTRRRR